MSDKNSKTSPQLPSDPLELITKAGKLNYSIDQTSAIVCSSFPGQTKDRIHKLLTNPGTKEYNAYQTGKSIRLFDVENALYDAAASGDVDAQEALLKLQVDKDVTEAIKDKFFPDSTTECE